VFQLKREREREREILPSLLIAAANFSSDTQITSVLRQETNEGGIAQNECNSNHAKH
jgi:hypothetical protein